MFNFASGQPYTVSYLFEGDYNGSGEYYGRPDIIGDPHKGVSGRTNLLNMAAFAAPCTVDSNGDCINGHPGSEGRNAFNASDFTNFDFSLTKTSHLNEWLVMELRFDAFNLFNHPNFSNPLLPGFGIDVFGNSPHRGRPSGGRRRPQHQRDTISGDHGDAGCGQRQPLPGRGRAAQRAVGGSFHVLVFTSQPNKQRPPSEAAFTLPVRAQANQLLPNGRFRSSKSGFERHSIESRRHTENPIASPVHPVRLDDSE